MSIAISEFYNESNDSPIFKFAKVGDQVAGDIVGLPVWSDDRFNPGEKSLCLTLDTGDGTVRLYLRKAQLRALGRAVTDTGSTTIAEGDWVSVQFADERDGRGAHPMRIWKCDYKAAPPMGDGAFGETF